MADFNTILNKIGDYAKTNFVINWASGVVIFGAMTFAIIMFYENKSLKDNITKQNILIKSQGKTIKTQGDVINTIKITFETMKTTIEAFKANPPSSFDEKINGIYRIIGIYHNGNDSHNPPAFHSTNPSGEPSSE